MHGFKLEKIDGNCKTKTMINVTAIKLPESFDAYKNTSEEKAEFLEPVSKINIFVGSNNSGKSRFLRLLTLLVDYEVKQNTVDLEKLRSRALPFLDNLEKYFSNYTLIRVNQNIDTKILNDFRTCFNGLINLGSDRFGAVREIFQELTDKLPKQIAVEGITGEISGGFVPELQNKIKEQSFHTTKLLKEIPTHFEPKALEKIYIPTLRGLRPLDSQNTDFYAERTEKDYFAPEVNDPQSAQAAREIAPRIFTGLTLYNELLNLKNGEYPERTLLLNYEQFISEKLFEDKLVVLIPKPKYKIVFVKIGKEQEQPIHHLGDGIQSTIILTFLPFINQDKRTFFFIEEPEMFMHPGLQRKLLDFYNSSVCKNHTFFMTTHSNHFLDITIDIKDVSIFTFRKLLDETKGEEVIPEITIESVDSGHESSLELLGVRNSSVFLVNATVWVEGITDRFYFRKMLSSYMDYLEKQKKLKLRLAEDTHYSFVEYGGANITHWSFLDSDKPQTQVERLCARAIVIIDKDGDSKELRKEALKKKLKKRLIELPCRGVENLLP